MPLIAFLIIVQIACAVHCIRHGRSNLWLMVIIFLSLPGCFAYALFEILPHYAGRREVRAAKSAAIRKLDPERDVRAARDALELADTAANRAQLGDALGETSSWSEAMEHYQAALAKLPGGDRAIRFKLARALLEAGDAAQARRILETLPESGSPSENDRARLLLARAVEECGDAEAAIALYADVGERLPGGEAHCRRAALLIASGRSREALPILEDVHRLAKRLDRFERAQQADMYGWAERTLTELRAGGAQDGA
ncbi:MAG TPA: tetratricopeptide repeat protein [Allosphingosinicella sp.]|nr:tetratricopeptide repeat protein [Allosphingosinicella sp.]